MVQGFNLQQVSTVRTFIVWRCVVSRWYPCICCAVRVWCITNSCTLSCCVWRWDCYACTSEVMWIFGPAKCGVLNPFWILFMMFESVGILVHVFLISSKNWHWSLCHCKFLCMFVLYAVLVVFIVLCVILMATECVFLQSMFLLCSVDGLSSVIENLSYNC